MVTQSQQPTLKEVVEIAQSYEKQRENGKSWQIPWPFLAKDAQPMFTVEKPGFRKLLGDFDPRYKLPSRKYFSETAIPRYILLFEIKLKIRFLGDNRPVVQHWIKTLHQLHHTLYRLWLAATEQMSADTLPAWRSHKWCHCWVTDNNIGYMRTWCRQVGNTSQHMIYNTSNKNISKKLTAI